MSCLYIRINPASAARRAARLAVFPLTLLVTLGATLARAEPFVDVEAGFFRDGNLTNAAPVQDRRADNALELAVRGGTWLVPTGYDVVTLAVEARQSLYARYADLDALSLGASATLRHKLGLGRRAPSLSLRVAAARDDYRGDLRDGDRLSLALEVGGRPLDALELAVGVVHEHRYGDYDVPLVPGYSGRVFDLAGNGVYAYANLAASDALTLSARVDVRRGDVESTAQPSRPIFVASDAIARDPAFDDPSLFAYRLPGTTWGAALGASFALSERTSLNASIAYALTRSPEDLEYRSAHAAAWLAFRYP